MVHKTGLGSLSVMAAGTWVLTCAVASAVDGEQQQPSGQDAAGRGPCDETTLDPAVAEILRIRRELGEDPYRGTIFDRIQPTAGQAPDCPGAASDSDSDFAAALRAAAASRAGPEHGSKRSLEQARSLPHGMAHGPFVASLRTAARGLDDKAADLEEIGQYAKADQLRRLANKVRTTARQFDPHYRATRPAAIGRE